MSTIISIIIIAIVIIVLVLTWYKEKSMVSRPEFSENDFPLINNDKGIVVEGPIYNDVKSACMDFCEMYNEKNYNIIIKLIRIDPNTNLLLFPFEIDFKYYCFLVNFLEYPIHQKYNSKVTGWLTSKKTDEWIDSRSVNKKIMVYNSSDPEFSDGIFFTTMDQIGFKVNFQSKNNVEELDIPIIRYYSCSRNIEDLNLLSGELIVTKT